MIDKKKTDESDPPHLPNPTIPKASFFLALVLPALFFLLALTFSASAQEQSSSMPPKGPPWRITADEVRYDQKTDQYFAHGDVLIAKEDLKLSADRVRFDHKAMEAFAEGEVMLVSGKDILTGKSMEVNLNNETGIVYEGTVFIEENHFYIRGDRLIKTGKDSYRAEQASITTCEGDSPAWKITARDVEVTIEGYGSAKHAALYAKKVPVLYTPYLFFPVKLKRQTGFLPPQFGYSDRKGAEYAQPFFWAIDESSDATFYAHVMGERGVRSGAEYRYKLGGLTQGAAMGEFLDDRKVDDGEGDSSDNWGYRSDKYLRPNEDRYWFRMKHDQELPEGFFARLDLDIVSDQDYLREFKDSYLGFGDTNSYFFGEFGRDLDEYDDPVRVNSLNVSKFWNLYSLNVEARWYDDVNKRRHEDYDDTLQKLPYANFNSLRQPILGSMFYWDLESEYTYFFREDSYTGHRMDVAPRVYLPLRLKNLLAFEPSVGLRETAWYIDDWDDFGDDGKDSFNREMVDVRLDLSTELDRTFKVDFETTDRVKHTIRPQVVYNYIPPISQDDIPQFDELDRIDRLSAVTYSVTNILSSRYRLPAIKSKEEADGAPSAPDSLFGYRPFGRLKVEQTYDLNETIENEPFSPIFAELNLVLATRLSLEADAEWSVYDDNFLNHNVAVRAADRRGDRVFIEHRYSRDRRETLYGDVIVKLHDRISMFGEYERDLKSEETVLYGLGFLYMASCWSLDAGYFREEDDSKYALMINLYGLGGIGSEYAGRKITNPFE